MNNEIKEVLDRLERIDHKKYKTAFEFADSAEFDEMASCFKERMIMADYITNLQQIEKDHQKLNGELRQEIKTLQEENEDLREDNYAYHQLMKIQNKREYRSKFLKEFQKEYGTNVFPDYDEIYKRYDKLKKENERLKEIVENLTTMTVCGDRKQIKNTAQYKLDICKSRIDKAIKYIEEEMPYLQEVDEEFENVDGEVYFTYKEWNGNKLLNILKGDDNEPR